MVLKMFSVFDKAVNAFLQPFFAPSAGAAIRMFTDACRDEKSSFSTHAHDYTLFHLGDWDDGTGITTPVDPHRLLGATEVIKKD